MDIVRNSINISGIATEEELPKAIHGQLIEFSESDYLYIPSNMPIINSINKIDVKVSCKQGRTIESPTGKIIVMDGTRRISVNYVPGGYYQNSFTVNFEIPFNTFIDLPNNAGEVKSIDVHVVDAYFKLVNTRKIYNHILYMVNVIYPTVYEANRSGETDININTLIHDDLEDDD